MLIIFSFQGLRIFINFEVITEFSGTIGTLNMNDKLCGSGGTGGGRVLGVVLTDDQTDVELSLVLFHVMRGLVQFDCAGQCFL